MLPFSGLEMLALGPGLYVTSRKVYRHEVITLGPDRIRIEVGNFLANGEKDELAFQLKECIICGW